MANLNYGNLIVEQENDGGFNEEFGNVDPLNNPPETGSNRFGMVRDRLFQVMLVKITLTYSQHVSYTFRRLIEFIVLITAFFLLCLLIYVNIILNQFPGSCLNDIRDIWPKKGVLRVEVIQNYDQFHSIQTKINPIINIKSNVCTFDLKNILKNGLNAIPELKHLDNQKTSLNYKLNLNQNFDNFNKTKKHSINANTSTNFLNWNFFSSFFFFTDYFFGSLNNLFENTTENYYNKHNYLTNLETVPINNKNDLKKQNDLKNFDQNLDVNTAYVYVIEYSLHYGLLKLSPLMRQELGIKVLLVQLDAVSDTCFGNWKHNFLMRYLTGFEDIIMSSVRALAENETEKGYLRDVISGEHYHFIPVGTSKISYLAALLIMLIFTFAISMLLRFSHHQIFLFIVDLLHMFDSNQPLIFPVAPLLTVILALVGMEAIMSEIFNDTTTAFYVILLVWIADQYDAICCKSSIGKRYWLRFFYLYHFAFYAYHYRFNGQYSGLALLTSSVFILHSMIFFFHHYEMPLIIYQERLRRVVNDLQHNTVNSSATLNVSITITERSPENSSLTTSINNEPNTSTTQRSFFLNNSSSRNNESLNGGVSNILTCTIRRFTNGRQRSTVIQEESITNYQPTTDFSIRSENLEQPTSTNLINQTNNIFNNIINETINEIPVNQLET